MPSVQSVREQFAVAKQRTLAATQALIVKTAKAEHAKVMGDDPRPVSFKRIVDGVVGVAEEAVRPSGAIIYDYDRLTVVAEFALQTLIALSPVKRGDYRNAHMFLLNGNEAPDLSGYQTGDEIQIANPIPYARKIEMGVSSKGHPMTMTVPGSDHVYQQAQQIVSARYHNVASVTFSYTTIVGSAMLEKWASSRSAAIHAEVHKRRGDRASEWLRRQPSLTISER